MLFFPAVIYGFCFTRFFFSIHIWFLFHAIFHFPLCLAFVSCRFSFPFTFLLIFSLYLNMQGICIWKQAVNQFFNQSIRQSSINMTIKQSNRQSVSLFVNLSISYLNSISQSFNHCFSISLSVS